MKVFYLVLCFPLLAGLGFGAAKGLLVLWYRQRAFPLLAAESGWFHLLFLSVPGTLVLAQAFREQTFGEMGLRWPALFHLPPWAALAVVAPVGVAVGLALYVNELVLSSHIRRLMSARAGPSLRAFVHGQSGSFSAPPTPPFANFMTVSGFTAFLEELVWRGFLVYFLSARLHQPVFLALLISGALFGINHAYFGLRNVLLKTFDGLVWGLLLVATSSLAGPFLSHLTFQYLVWRRIQRRAAGVRMAQLQTDREDNVVGAQRA